MDLSNFKAIKDIYYSRMFENCTSLTYVNFNNFSFQVSADSIFSECPSITFIDISSFWTENSEVSLFGTLPPKGEIIANTSFISKLKEGQIPEGWTITLID